MHARNPDEQAPIDKIRTLPPDKVAEIEDFVDLLRQRADDRQLVEASTRLSEDTFREVWDNSEDAAYSSFR